ncbi:MAG: N-acetylmuramoyl-L-alanine amidase [Chloroflexi bacterium]|nr:N-acetylmuramoyl-L-alanine amidase [Chloroflexota bacterium]
MPSRITRRAFVGWLTRSASAGAALGLLGAGMGTAGVARAARLRPGDAPDAERTPVQEAARETGHETAPETAADADGPVRVRMADLVLEGRALRAGQADGVRLPSQGGDAWSLTAERPGGVYVTTPRQAEFPCSHVGVHWRTDGGDQAGLRVELRASRDGQAWTSWRPVLPESHGVERAGDVPGQRTFGAVHGVRLAQTFQVRLTFGEAGPEQASVSGITLTCLDSRRAAEGRPSALIPVPSQREPLALRAGLTGFLDRVVTREAWGADESLRFKDGEEVWPTAFVTPSLLVVHHTAGDHDITDPEAEVRAIYAYHAVTQGWGDIGYNLLIDSSGRVYEGRRGRDPGSRGQREIVGEGVVAGHALDYNYGSAGVALLGNYQVRQPSTATIDTLVETLTFLAFRYGIDPTTVAAYPRARSDGTVMWRDSMNAVSGHRDCLPTECPGDNVYPLLAGVRQRVEEALGGRTPGVRITRGPADRNAWPGDLVFGWEADSETAEVSTRLAGWIRMPGSDKIVPASGYTDDERPAWEPWTGQRDLSVALPPNARGVYTLFVRARSAGGEIGRTVAHWHVAVDRHAVLDDTDALRTRHEGVWTRSRAVLGYYGSGYQVAEAGQEEALFRWQLAVPEAGAYQVQASWTEGEDRSAEAVYHVSQGGQPLGEATVSQQERGGRWVTLLTAALAAGAPCVVELAGSEDGAVVADAVRLVQVPD